MLGFLLEKLEQIVVRNGAARNETIDSVELLTVGFDHGVKLENIMQRRVRWKNIEKHQTPAGIHKLLRPKGQCSYPRCVDRGNPAQIHDNLVLSPVKQGLKGLAEGSILGAERKTPTQVENHDTLRVPLFDLEIHVHNPFLRCHGDGRSFSSLMFQTEFV